MRALDCSPVIGLQHSAMKCADVAEWALEQVGFDYRFPKDDDTLDQIRARFVDSCDDWSLVSTRSWYISAELGDVALERTDEGTHVSVVVSTKPLAYLTSHLGRNVRKVRPESIGNCEVYRLSDSYRS